MQNVIADVLRFISNVFQIGVGSVSCEQALSFLKFGMDNKTSVVQLPGIRLGDVRCGAKNEELQSIDFPPRVVKLFLAIRRIEFCAVIREVISVFLEILPLFVSNAAIVVATLLRRANQTVYTVSVIFQVCETVEMVIVLVGNEDAAELLVGWQEMRVIANSTAVYEKRV